MNFLSYSLIALISFLGLIAGIIIISMAKEEQAPGKKYFILLQKIILSLIVIFLLYFLKLNFAVFAICSLIIITLYIKKYRNKKLIESIYLYPLLAIIFYLSSNLDSLFLIESGLIFLYGLVTSSLLLNIKKNNSIKIVFNHISFIIVALILFFI